MKREKRQTARSSPRSESPSVTYLPNPTCPCGPNGHTSPEEHKARGHANEAQQYGSFSRASLTKKLVSDYIE